MQQVDRQPGVTRTLSVTLSPRPIVLALFVGAAVLVATDLVSCFIGARQHGLTMSTALFYGDEKVNFPTAYKTTTLLLGAVLLWLRSVVSARARERWTLQWRILAAGVAFCFVDESISLHQRLSDKVHDTAHTSGAFSFAWPLIYIPLALVVFALIVPLFWHLEARLRTALIVAGVLYAGGAGGLEPIKSSVAQHGGGDATNLTYSIAAWVSDSCEMVGLALLCSVMLYEVARHSVSVTLRGPDGEPHEPTS